MSKMTKLNNKTYKTPKICNTKKNNKFLNQNNIFNESDENILDYKTKKSHKTSKDIFDVNCLGYEMNIEYSSVDDIGKDLMGMTNIYETDELGNFSDAIFESKISRMDRMIYGKKNKKDFDEIQNLSNYSFIKNDESSLSEINLIKNQDDSIDTNSQYSELVSNCDNTKNTFDKKQNNLENSETDGEISPNIYNNDENNNLENGSNINYKKIGIKDIYNYVNKYSEKCGSNFLLLLIIIVGIGIIYLIYKLVNSEID